MLYCDFEHVWPIILGQIGFLCVWVGVVNYIYKLLLFHKLYTNLCYSLTLVFELNVLNFEHILMFMNEIAT